MVFTVLGCSSELKNEGKAEPNGKFLGLDDYDQDSTAHGAAFRVDAMTVRRPMKSRDWKPVEFYYKHCTEIGETAYFKKTSYECSGPY